jgi:hypothetical protein
MISDVIDITLSISLILYVLATLRYISELKKQNDILMCSYDLVMEMNRDVLDGKVENLSDENTERTEVVKDGED